MASLPPPVNKFLEAVKKSLDTIILGLGVDVAYQAGVAGFPPLGAPVIGALYKGALKVLAEYLDKNGKKIASILVIRFQDDVRKDDYEKKIQPIKDKSDKGELPTDAELQAAKDAMDALITRNK